MEIDGPSHDVRVAYDEARTKLIEAQGYRVLRFTNEDVMQNLEGVLMMIGQVLAEMSLPTPSPSRLREGNHTDSASLSSSPPLRRWGWASTETPK